MITPIKSITAFIILFFFASSSYSSPYIENVSGTVSENQEVKIEGTDFGVNNSPAPILKDDFENGETGELLQNEAWTGGGDEGRFSTANPRTGDQSAHWHFDKGGYYHKYQNIGDRDTVYVTFWVYNSGVTGSNMKSVRVTNSDDSNSDHPEYTGNPRLYTRTDVYSTWDNFRVNGSIHADDGTTIDGYFAETRADRGEWHRVEFYYQLNDFGSSNGKAYFCKVGGTCDTLTDIEPRTEDGSTFDTLFLGQGLAGFEEEEDSPGDIYIDDLYVSGSKARVEIGNNENFHDCTYREIQTPKKWGDSDITININKGTFEDNENAYLFIVDREGNVSSGYPINFDEYSKEEALPEPNNLAVNP